MKIKKLFPNELIIKTKHFYVAQDWEVPIPGFFILSANRKMISIIDFTEEEAKEFIKLLCFVRKCMKDVLGINNLCLFQAEKNKFNSFHVWIFPRYEWMNKFGKNIDSILPIINYAKKKYGN